MQKEVYPAPASFRTFSMTQYIYVDESCLVKARQPDEHGKWLVGSDTTERG
jgi:hypothetical protein